MAAAPVDPKTNPTETPLRTAALWAVEANLAAAEHGLGLLEALWVQGRPGLQALQDAGRLVCQAKRQLGEAVSESNQAATVELLQKVAPPW